jgi:4-amino-4-deoxy-L-arabinose transferase-like glycosyltransferase
VSRINHQPTDRDKAPWKRVALIVLIAIWLLPGIFGRDPWKPDEPIFVGILHSMFVDGGDAWWSPQTGGYVMGGETPFIHWLNAALAYLPMQVLPLHTAARVSSVFWCAVAILSLAFAASRWSAGHVSYLAAIVLIGCLGLYDRAHAYTPEIALLAAISLALWGIAELADRHNRATWLIGLAVLLAFMSHGSLGFLLIALPTFALMFAPVLSMHRVALARAIVLALALCALLSGAFALRAPESFSDWLNAGAGLSLFERERFAPHAYVIALLWFAWPAWPIAVWTLVLRGRGFAGGWQRAEIVVPVVFFTIGFIVLNAFAEQRTIYTIVFLPPLVLLAAFGVDTIRRTWYAMIDWFGILVLGIASVLVFVASVALYAKWPVNIATWAEKYVPNFSAPLPWFGYGIALIAFLIWLVLVQPAHQHSRRALINWAGCVTFVWIVAQALLVAPADFRSSHRSVFQTIDKQWPASGCVNGIDLPASHIAMLDYTVGRRVDVVDSMADVTCEYLLIVRERHDRAPEDTSGFATLYSGARPGDRGEKIELLRSTNARAANPTESKL